MGCSGSDDADSAAGGSSGSNHGGNGAGGRSGGNGSGGAQSTRGGASANEAGRADDGGAGASPSAGMAGTLNVGGAAAPEGGSGGEAAGAGGSAGGSVSGGAGGDDPGSDAGAGGSAGSPLEPTSSKPDRIRPMGGTLTDYLAHEPPVGGTVYHDVCPSDQVVIGFHYSNYVDFLNGLGVDCGTIKLSWAAEVPTLSVEPGVHLRFRAGGDAEDEGVLSCPQNQVVVGLQSVYNDWIRKLVVSCAPLELHAKQPGPGYEIVVGTKTALPPIGKDSTPNPGHPLQDSPYVGCPAGSISRGTQMNAGFWFEAVGLYCAQPKLSFPRGGACNDASDCTGVSQCDPARHVCARAACGAPGNCSCAELDGKLYSFCSRTTDSQYANAGSLCAEQGRRLASAKTGLINGWQRYAALEAAVGDAYWIAADSLDAVGSWSWAYAGGALGFSDWYEGTDTAATDLRCASVADHGAWVPSNCAEPKSFVCE